MIETQHRTVAMIFPITKLELLSSPSQQQIRFKPIRLLRGGLKIIQDLKLMIFQIHLEKSTNQ